MKMINDMDMYYANVYAKSVKPMWMKDERIDYCDTRVSAHKTGSFLSSFLNRIAK